LPNSEQYSEEHLNTIFDPTLIDKDFVSLNDLDDGLSSKEEEYLSCKIGILAKQISFIIK
jgi:hypothetical protein